MGATEAFPWLGGVPLAALAAARGVPGAGGLPSDAHLHGGIGRCRGHLEKTDAFGISCTTSLGVETVRLHRQYHHNLKFNLTGYSSVFFSPLGLMWKESLKSAALDRQKGMPKMWLLVQLPR